MKVIKGYFIPDKDYHYQEYFTQFDHYQEAQRNRALSYVSDWENAIDIGANIGLWSKELTKFFNNTYCFEPNIECLDCLKKNIDFSKAQIFNVALGSKNSTNYLYSPNNTGASSLVNKTKFLGYDDDGKELWDQFDKSVEKKKVNIKNLDSFNLTKINFIKVDVQNYELEVIKGAKRTLEINDPVICIEENSKNLDFSDTINLLKKLNYSILDRIGKEIILKKI